MAAPRGIHHVQLNVADVPEAMRFYAALGMAPRADRPDRGNPGAWLDAGGSQVHLSESSDVGPKHFALEFEDLDAVLVTLRASGFAVDEPRSVGPGLPRQTSLDDPAGNRVELREPAH